MMSAVTVILFSVVVVVSVVTKFKCPQCGERQFAVIKWKQKNSYDSRSKEKALFGCDSCDYREVI